MPNRKKVAIIMGSDSDWPVVKSACGVLKDFDVPFEAHILSAHRTPEAAAAFAKVQKAHGTAARQLQRRGQHNLPAPMVTVLSCALPVWRPTWQVPLPPTPLCRWSASR